MKHVIAIIKPFKHEAVFAALQALGVRALAAAEVRGYGRQKGHLELYRGSEYRITFLPKVRIECACEDHELDAVLTAIREHARTGRIGDGKVFVLDADEAARAARPETAPGF